MTGTTNRHMPMLMAVWKISMAAIPTQTLLWNGVSARFATVSTRKMIAASSAITARHPTSPSSSPQTAKIRSVWRAGRLVRELLWVWVPCM